VLGARSEALLKSELLAVEKQCAEIQDACRVDCFLAAQEQLDRDYWRDFHQFIFNTNFLIQRWIDADVEPGEEQEGNGATDQTSLSTYTLLWRAQMKNGRLTLDLDRGDIMDRLNFFGLFVDPPRLRPAEEEEDREQEL
jgi:hypothetical protein